MSNDIYCVRDKVFLVKVRLGEIVKQANDKHTELYSRRGDLYQCPECGYEAIGDFGAWS